MGSGRFTQADLDRLRRGERQPQRTQLTTEEGRRLFNGQGLPPEPAPAPMAKGSKLHNEPTVYNGKRYDSKAEARHAAQLDLRVRCGELVNVEAHVVYRLEVAGVLITTYEVDFILTYPDGRQEWHDVKGRTAGGAWQMFVIKQCLMKALLGIDVQVVKATKAA